MMLRTKGTDDGEFKSPNVIELDPKSGDIYAAENHDNCIQKFTQYGKFILSGDLMAQAMDNFHSPKIWLLTLQEKCISSILRIITFKSLIATGPL
jgi:hypothetical protein